MTFAVAKTRLAAALKFAQLRLDAVYFRAELHNRFSTFSGHSCLLTFPRRCKGASAAKMR